jgi:diaminohydroxyphosphoribosylaminopyrimidine deaminase / 5-amino-6-(5-phosphoribosylamino)uracil reductase
LKGGGAETLRAAGLVAHFWNELPNGAEASRRAERLIAPFAKRVTYGLPWITVKQAINRDGSMNPTPGAKTFTSPASLDLAHQLRKRADAILTGSGTVLADAPLLNVRRVPDFPGKRRTLVLMDRRNRIPKDYIEDAMERGFDVLRPASLAEAFSALGKAGANEVLVEAGPELTKAVLSSGQWDEHVLIKQGTASDLPNTVTITTNPKSESDHVLRNH